MKKKWLISRRTVLKGFGYSLSLPLLDIMIPNKTAFAQQSKSPNLIIDLFPNGFYTNKQLDPPQYLIDEIEKIRSYTNQVSILTGLRHPGREETGRHGLGTPHQDNYVGFMRAAGYRGEHDDRATSPHFTTTFDQMIVNQLSAYNSAPVSTLALRMSDQVYSKERGSALHERNLSWRRPGEEVDSYYSPKQAFDLVHGNITTGPVSRAPTSNNTPKLTPFKNILDAVMEQRRKLNAIASTEDKYRLDQFYTSVDEMQKSYIGIKKNPVDTTPIANPASSCPEQRYNDPVRSYKNKLEFMQQLMITALQCGVTKVTTLQRGNSSNNSIKCGFVNNDYDQGWHDYSHFEQYGTRNEFMEINKWVANDFDGFCKKLSEVKDPIGESLLDNSLVVHGSWIGRSQNHKNEGLMMTLVGGASGKMKLGQNINKVQNLSNLWLTIMNSFGVNVNSYGSNHRFGRSDGKIDQLTS